MYLILKIDTREVWEFETPDECATFMWGRDFAEYTVFVRFPWSDGNLANFKEALTLHGSF